MRRSWPQRLLLSFNVFAVFVCLSAAGLIVYAHDTVADTQRTRILDVEGWVPSERVPAGDPINFLVVGTDSAEGLEPDDQVMQGRDEVDGIRSDVIMIVRLDPKTSEAGVLSFPRDLWVNIPGRGQERINAAMNFGEDRGPSKLIETINTEFGITINHYVEVNFAAFKNIIDVIGGVRTYISHPLEDGHSGLHQPEVGCQLLDADQALAYARSRHLRWQRHDGTWVADPTSDIGRIRRQQDFLQRVIAQAIRKGARNPATLNRLIQKTQGSVKFDRYMTVQDLLHLGRAFDSFEPGELQAADLPVYNEKISGKWIVQLSQPQADAVLDQFRGTGDTGIASEVNPADVNLRVLNGGAIEGSAVEASEALRGVGFRTQTPGDAEEVRSTEVRFPRGQLADARFVARYIASDVDLILDPTVSEITIVLSPDDRGVLDRPKNEDEVPEEAEQATTTTEVIEGWDDDVTTTTTSPVTTTTLDEHGDPERGASYVPGAVPAGASC